MPFVGGVQPGSLTLGDRFKEMGYATHLNGRPGWPSRAVYSRISFKAKLTKSTFLKEVGHRRRRLLEHPGGHGL